MNNVVVAVFSGTTSTRTRQLWKIDKGMLLQLVGLNLPAAYQVHFSNNPDSGRYRMRAATFVALFSGEPHDFSEVNT